MKGKKRFMALFLFAMLFLTACGKQKWDDPNIEDQYWIYLEDEQTGQVISDQVFFTKFKNGTSICGYTYVRTEEECYQILEAHLYEELERLKTALEVEAQQAAMMQNATGVANSTS